MKFKLTRGYKEALQAAAAIGIFVFFLFWLSGCASVKEAWVEKYPTEVRAFVAWDPHDRDAKSPIGRQPTGNILITQPLPGYLEVNYLHISSVQDYYDRATIDQFGVGVCVKVPLRACR